MNTLLWIESGSCSGETMAMLGAEGPGSEAPGLVDFLEQTKIELLWHPSLSAESPKQVGVLIEKIISGLQELTILCVEGSILHGPNGTGMYDTFLGKPKRDAIEALCHQATYVLAMGTCAAYGGIPAAPPNPTEAGGLQFNQNVPGGLLGVDWRSKSGLPVINLAGCPVSSSTMFSTIRWSLAGMPLGLDSLNRPFTVGPCNSDSWNKKCGKPKVGFNCYGCTTARFPRNGELFDPVPVSSNEKAFAEGAVPTACNVT